MATNKLKVMLSFMREINDGNVIFKTLRRLGYIGKIIDLIDDIYDKKAGFEI